ncbi:MAG: hypothetical protein AAFP07_08140, partial [Cyanobacteria bacterium J06606_4]
MISKSQAVQSRRLKAGGSKQAAQSRRLKAGGSKQVLFKIINQRMYRQVCTSLFVVGERSLD